ncbi:type II toxin-antitoxin system VapC family toxin [Mucilaginibacter sabulilitoris]|uniref:Ribonuclease VapC n=1 Tax=Mucilaginibacter sabulilitoris TaxID=1173583 RepID=A0ABZ0TQQ6_9SPHI|nr:type II toxin-antitoxin system VapC family toxin [Mucilaginibacter sabulilitoris]WPU95191.1 type II toxin-antitoxin system VapC family toxin [Mucilaginibacter sabulilitoris]
MADKIVLADTSLLIDFFGKSDKSNSKLISLMDAGYRFCICAITEYEIYTGATDAQMPYWKKFLESIEILSFDSAAVTKAIDINKRLKLKNKQIAIPDLFIAAIAVSNNLPVATLNKKHFDRINDLTLVDIK